MTIETVQRNNAGNDRSIYGDLIYAVDIHRKAMQLVFCPLFQALTAEYNNVGELSVLIMFIIHFSYLAIGSYMAQEIIDHNNHVFATVYNVQWYVASLNVQKMVLFLLQRGNKAFNINIGGLIVGSLQGAATVKYLLDQLEQICSELKNKKEIAILENYATVIKRFTIIITQ
ncbi:PREDICTED: uncharacterized protein LOC106746672 [Dinoponera quadriceps]|uniref:Uncharacterized protein LOC106746672 n=1 Tax=Dinoponera quadriceps TaxID=609295 RepID=A0A6P3XKG5_DINQU|nr:PREDICTED: uncharacterized protein LOC106746672 [Dinoponera quadriceps]